MATPSPPQRDSALLRALRQEFIFKLQEDWDTRWKPLGHGESFAGLSALPNQARFVTQLFEHVYETLTRRFGSRAAANDFMIDHERTLARFLSDTYDKGFSAKTRNTIACYVGYDSFADFVRQYREAHDPPPAVTVISLLPVPVLRQVLRLPPSDAISLASGRPWRRWALGALVLVAGFGLVWAYASYRRTRPLPSDAGNRVVLREATRNAAVSPCWVTFDYDFSALGLDSLYLHQGGSVGIEEAQQAVSPAKGRLSLGFYKGGVKLLTLRHRDQVVKRLPLTVPTGGWNCYVAGPGWVHPDFIKKHYVREGCLFVNPNESIIDPQIRSYFMTHHYLSQRFGVGLDSLTLECRIQNKPDAFGISCYDTRLTLVDEQANEVAVEFIRSGCAERSTRPGEILQPVSLPDRRALGVSLPRILDRFYLLRVVLKNGILTTYLDDRQASSNPYPRGFGGLAEVRFKFKGSGKVDFLRLSHSHTGRAVYADDFGGPAGE